MEVLFYILTILILQIIGIVFKVEIVSIFLIAIVSVFIFFLEKKKDNSALIPILIVFLLAIQNFVIGIFAHYSGNVSKNLSYMTQVSTVVTYVISGLILVFKKKKFYDYIFIVLIFLLIGSLVLHFNSGSITGILNYLRNYTCFYCFFIIGSRFLNDKKTINFFLKFIVILSVIMCLIGFAYNALPFNSFEKLGIVEIYIAKGAEITSTTDFAGRFSTTIFFTSVQRIGSIMYEPINFGYFLIVPLLVCSINLFIKKNIKYLIPFLIVLFGFVTTYAKGPWTLVLILFVTYLAYLLIKLVNKNVIYSKLTFNILVIVCIVFTLFFSLYYYKNIGTSTNTHFWAIERTFYNCLEKPIFGYGLGSGGNYGSQIDGWLESGGESGLMSLIYQMGFPFAIMFVFIHFGISYDLYVKKNQHLIISFLPICLIIMSLFQENTYTPQCIGMIMIFLGGIYNQEEKVFSVLKENSYCETMGVIL